MGHHPMGEVAIEITKGAMEDKIVETEEVIVKDMEEQKVEAMDKVIEKAGGEDKDQMEGIEGDKMTEEDQEG